MITFREGSPRIKGNLFVFEDTAINCWGAVDDGTPIPRVDGIAYSARRSTPRRDVRNSLFRFGRTRLGDRHILEIEGKGAVLTAVDAKVCPNRRFFPVSSGRWKAGGLPPAPFASEWGAPYGDTAIVLQPGKTLAIEVVATDVSLAYVDEKDGGGLNVRVDGEEKLVIEADKPYVTVDKRTFYLENRKGILGLPYGLHRVEVEAVDKPVRVLGLFAYDSRPNRAAERVLRGFAAAGETVTFSAPFRARPLVRCGGGLTARPEDITPRSVTFSGQGQGWFEVVGE
jgi:hypothetical protein